jgi:hypothetical protein
MGIKVLSCNVEVDVAGERKEVDGKRETLHNLTSLLLTNKTICRQVARRSAEQSSLKINSR